MIIKFRRLSIKKRISKSCLISVMWKILSNNKFLSMILILAYLTHQANDQVDRLKITLTMIISYGKIG